MSDTLTKKEFWKRLDKIQAGMLSVADTRPVPMSPYTDADTGTIWFITAKGTDIESALRGGPRSACFTVACPDAQLYATIKGSVHLSMDQPKLSEIWNPIADAWFDGGKTDPDVQLVRFDLVEAEAWATSGVLSFFYEIAKAQMTDGTPDMGDHGMLKFAA